MVYDTRRKSLYLPDLGIELPQTHASKAAARSSPLSTATSASEHQFSKKSKRPYGEDSCSLSPPTKKRPHVKVTFTSRPLSPPPDVDDIKLDRVKDEVNDDDVKLEDVKPRVIDMDEINDEIVEGVIIQLQKTDNRPHLVKELAAILSRSVKIVEQ